MMLRENASKKFISLRSKIVKTSYKTRILTIQPEIKNLKKFGRRFHLNKFNFLKNI